MRIKLAEGKFQIISDEGKTLGSYDTKEQALGKIAFSIEEDIKPSLNYLGYVLKHKYNVLGPGLLVGADPIDLVKHDWSKFKPKSFIAYRNWFAGPQGRNAENPSETIRKKFRREADRHKATESHHVTYPGHGPRTLDRELEAIADWYSVYKTNEPNPLSFKEWFVREKKRFVGGSLSPDTILHIEQKLKEGNPWWNVFL